MLDAVAGFVVRRMAAGHLNAVTKPSDLAQLLQAYAALGHSTVVMPELLTAASNQVCSRVRHADVAEDTIGNKPDLGRFGEACCQVHQ